MLLNVRNGTPITLLPDVGTIVRSSWGTGTWSWSPATSEPPTLKFSSGEPVAGRNGAKLRNAITLLGLLRSNWPLGVLLKIPAA